MRLRIATKETSGIYSSPMQGCQTVLLRAARFHFRCNDVEDRLVVISFNISEQFTGLALPKARKKPTGLQYTTTHSLHRPSHPHRAIGSCEQASPSAHGWWLRKNCNTNRPSPKTQRRRAQPQRGTNKAAPTHGEMQCTCVASCIAHLIARDMGQPLLTSMRRKH